MKTVLKSLTLAVACLLGIHSADPVCACSFCPPDLRPSLWKHFDRAQIAVFAELIQKPNSDSMAPFCRYRVSTVLKGGQRVRLEDQFDVPLNDQSPLGSVHLFLADSDSTDWQAPRGISKKMRAFLELAAKLPRVTEESSLEAKAQRLALALPHLVSRDRQIADSAFGEFATAPDEAVMLLKPMLNPHELIAWSEFGLLTPQRSRLIYMLLGVCGDQRSLSYVKSALDDRLARSESTELDAIVSTYLTLKGEPALKEIEWILNPTSSASLSTRRAVANALRFHVDNESKIDKRRLIASCRLLLNDPRTADHVLSDLTRWEDWDSLNAVLELREDAGEKRWLKNPIAEYLEACPLPAAESALAASLPQREQR